MSLYGNFRNPKFTDIYENVESFIEDYNNVGIKPNLTKNETVETLYYLLYAAYGNSTIASSDVTRFKYQLFSTIFSYGPTWEGRLRIQSHLRALLDNPTELFAGATQVNNQAYNPGTAPSTSSTDELAAINQQVVTKYKKDKMTGYATLMDLLATDVTTEFIKKFNKLFIKIVQPEEALWYIEEDNP